MTTVFPDSWQLMKIDDLKAKSAASIAIGPFGSRMKSDNYVEHGIPVIRGNNISGSKKLSGEFVYITPEFADTLGSANVFAGDLVFPHRGAIGEVGIVTNEEFSRYVISTSLMKLTCNSDLVDSKFLFYFFRSPNGRHELLKNASTVGTPGIGTPLTSLKAITVPLPPLEIQQKIASILGALDDKIELNRRMNATLESIAQTVFKSWFVDFDPVKAKAAGMPPEGLDAETAALFPSGFQPSSLGEIPEDWEAGTIKDFFNLTMGQSPPGDTYNENGEGLPFFQGKTDFGFRFPSRRIYCTAPTRFANTGDTLMSVRAPVGTINMALERCVLGRGVAAIRHKSGTRSFTYYAMDSKEEIFEQFNGEGTVFGSINKIAFERIEFVSPPKVLVLEFEKMMSSFDEQILQNQLEIEALATARDSLLPKLLSGELGVEDFKL